MKKIKLLLSRYRLLGSILVLAISLVALVTAPPPVRADIICEEMGCVNWSYDWCFETRRCCVDEDSGLYKCKDTYHSYPYYEE